MGKSPLRDYLWINMEAANVHTNHTTETSFLLPFQKVTNKKLPEIPSSIQKKHHPTAKFEAVFVFLVPIFFPQPWLGISRGPHSIFTTFLGSNSSALRRCETDGIDRYFYNLLTNK